MMSVRGIGRGKKKNDRGSEVDQDRMEAHGFEWTGIRQYRDITVDQLHDWQDVVVSCQDQRLLVGSGVIGHLPFLGVKRRRGRLGEEMLQEACVPS